LDAPVSWQLHLQTIKHQNKKYTLLRSATIMLFYSTGFLVKDKGPFTRTLRVAALCIAGLRLAVLRCVIKNTKSVFISAAQQRAAYM